MGGARLDHGPTNCFPHALCILIIFLKIAATVADFETTDFSPLVHQVTCTTSTQQYSYLNTLPTACVVMATKCLHHPLMSNRINVTLLIMAGDIELNPGPFESHKNSSYFSVCTVNVCSIMKPEHSAALFDLTDCHHPDVVAITETWLQPTATAAELGDITPRGYTLLSKPRETSDPTIDSNTWKNTGGGVAFLYKDALKDLPTHHPDFTAFELLGITLNLPKGNISVFNTYRPQNLHHIRCLSRPSLNNLNNSCRTLCHFHMKSTLLETSTSISIKQQISKPRNSSHYCLPFISHNWSLVQHTLPIIHWIWSLPEPILS